MATVIKVENLGKKYIISHEKKNRYQYKTIQESLLGAGRSIWNSLRHPLSADPETSETEESWALTSGSKFSLTSASAQLTVAAVGF